MKGMSCRLSFITFLVEPFCQERRCRLFNAHWQEEVLEAQLGQPEFCDRHTKLLQELRLG
jgi:hypothetical protein